jgi:hypothetical protein
MIAASGAEFAFGPIKPTIVPGTDNLDLISHFHL